MGTPREWLQASTHENALNPMELQRFRPVQPPARAVAIFRFSECDGKLPGALNEIHLAKRSLVYRLWTQFLIVLVN